MESLGRIKFKIYFGLAFIWPAKKNTLKVDNKVEEAHSILEKADTLFENGHYEECYKILAESEEIVVSICYLNSYA